MRALDPGVPSAEASAHLDTCERCREFQRKLVQIETNVPRLPVPAAPVPASLWQALARQNPSEPTPAAPPPAYAGGSPHAATAPSPSARVSGPARSRSRLAWIVAGLAASIAVAAFGIWYAVNRQESVNLANNKGPENSPASQPFLAQLLDCNVRLAVSDKPKERTQVLAKLAGHLQDGIESKPGDAALQKLAKLYRETLTEGLVPAAKSLPRVERESVLTPVALDLARFHETALQLAPGDTSFQDIVDTADETRQQLESLLPDGKPTPRDESSSPAGVRPRLNVDWQRDWPLIQAMVFTARKLVLEDNPFRRAQFAQDLAESLGKSIRQSAQDGDGKRITELGHYVQTLLTDAVAANVGKARSGPDTPSPLERDRFVRSARALEADLHEAAVGNAGIEAAARTVADVRSEVEILDFKNIVPGPKEVSPPKKERKYRSRKND